MAEMKGIKLCGECGNYDWKKHKCKIGCNDDSNAQSSFYGDCPLPDVVPKSEVEALQGALKAEERHNELTMEMAQKALKNAKSEVAREIFDEIEGALECAYDSDQQSDYPIPYYHEYLKDNIAELKKKYTEEVRNDEF